MAVYLQLGKQQDRNTLAAFREILILAGFHLRFMIRPNLCVSIFMHRVSCFSYLDFNSSKLPSRSFSYIAISFLCVTKQFYSMDFLYRSMKWNWREKQTGRDTYSKMQAMKSYILPRICVLLSIWILQLPWQPLFLMHIDSSDNFNFPRVRNVKKWYL